MIQFLDIFKNKLFLFHPPFRIVAPLAGFAMALPWLFLSVISGSSICAITDALFGLANHPSMLSSSFPRKRVRAALSDVSESSPHPVVCYFSDSF
jgi:hypothetical protein